MKHLVVVGLVGLASILIGGCGGLPSQTGLPVAADTYVIDPAVTFINERSEPLGWVRLSYRRGPVSGWSRSTRAEILAEDLRAGETRRAFCEAGPEGTARLTLVWSDSGDGHIWTSRRSIRFGSIGKDEMPQVVFREDGGVDITCEPAGHPDWYTLPQIVRCEKHAETTACGFHVTREEIGQAGVLFVRFRLGSPSKHDRDQALALIHRVIRGAFSEQLAADYMERFAGSSLAVHVKIATHLKWVFDLGKARG